MKRKNILTIIILSATTAVAIMNVNLAKIDPFSSSLFLDSMESISSESSENSNWKQVNSCQTKEKWTYHYYVGNPLYVESAKKTSTCDLGTSNSCTQGYLLYDYDVYQQPHLVITDITTKNCTSW
jgi:hypothetical protein